MNDLEDEDDERPRAGFFLHVVPALLYVFAVFYGGSVGMAAPGMDFRASDKLLHAAAFAGMHLVILRAVRFELPKWPFRRQNVATLVVVSAVGGLLELYQAALPHRSAEVLDWVADTVGALLMAGVLFLLARQRDNR